MTYDEEQQVLREHLRDRHAWGHPPVGGLTLGEARVFHGRDHRERTFPHDETDLTSGKET